MTRKIQGQQTHIFLRSNLYQILPYQSVVFIYFPIHTLDVIKKILLPATCKQKPILSYQHFESIIQQTEGQNLPLILKYTLSRMFGLNKKQTQRITGIYVNIGVDPSRLFTLFLGSTFEGLYWLSVKVLQQNE